MSDNTPDIHAPESGVDDICTPERLDNSPNIDTSESDADNICTPERLDNSLDIHAPERADAKEIEHLKLDNSLDIHASESEDNLQTLCNQLDNSLDIHASERSTTCNNQESILKKAKLIRNFGIASFSFMGVIILCIIMLIAVVISSIPSYPDSVWVIANVSKVVGIVTLGISIANFVFIILAIIKIADTDWGNENLNKSKKGFWITILCCLIGGFIVLILMITGSLSPLASALAIIGLVFSLPLGITPPIMYIIWGNKVKKTYSTNKKA